MTKRTSSPTPSPSRTTLGFDAAIFDLDGVITFTARVHEAAWKELFDTYLRSREERYGEPFRPFTDDDYRAHVDGRPRYEGVRTFLASRGIALPHGDPSDPPDAETISGLGNRKDERFRELLRERGVEVDSDAVRFIGELRAQQTRVGVASSSRNTELVLDRAGLTNLFDASVDGVLSARLGLRGKPAPDSFLECLRRLGVSDPRRAMVVEDAEVGVEAGRAGGFGLVLGVDRGGHAAALSEHGADWIVRDFHDVTLDQVREHFASRDDARAGALDTLDDATIAPTADPSWQLVEEGFDLAREHEIESLFAIANGYMGTRGSLAEGSPLSAPATFVAGIFDRSDGAGSVPALVTAPDWMCVRATIDGEEVRLERGVALLHRRVLDLRQGILWRQWRHRDPSGRVSLIRGLRLASLADRHVLLQSIDFTPESYRGHLSVETRIEGNVPWLVSTATTPGERAPPESVPPESTGAEPVPAVPVPAEPHEAPLAWLGAVVLTLRTEGTGRVVSFATASSLESDGPVRSRPNLETDERRLIERWELDVEIGRRYRLCRFVTVYTSRDTNHPAEAAAAHLGRLGCEGVERIMANHIAAWRERWRTADVEIDGDEYAQRALRFACYHMIAAANPDDERVSIGARMLTGGAYKGHVFWDTEIYMLPFYTFTHPASARALLAYRHHTLRAARENAHARGWRGALYAWESADTGEETTPPWVLAPDGAVVPVRNGEQENHISADIAYAVWHYWVSTGDDDFFLDSGAEILLETARFWASRGELEADGRYHIRHVIGPDEYHEDVDDSAYTNVMAQWNLERGLDAVRLLRERWPSRWGVLADRIALAPDEPERWGEVASAMYTGFDPATRVFEQFRGYFDLEEVDLAAYEPRSAPMDLLLGREKIGRTKVIKQADVVLLIRLLWDRFPPEVREANFRYYEPRCAHGSSLSPSMHALVAARLGDTERAERYFRQSAEIDLADNMGNAAGGVHAAALGGLWQAVIFGFAGLHFGPGGPLLDARLPRNWSGVRFPIQWRGRTLRMNAVRAPRPEVQR